MERRTNVADREASHPTQPATYYWYTEVPFKSLCRQEIDRLGSPPPKPRYPPIRP